MRPSCVNIMHVYAARIFSCFVCVCMYIYVRTFSFRCAPQADRWHDDRRKDIEPYINQLRWTLAVFYRLVFIKCCVHGCIVLSWRL